MREILEQLAGSLIEVASKVEVKDRYFGLFKEVVIPETVVKTSDLTRAFGYLKVSQSDHPAENTREEIRFAVYPLADLRWKNVLTPDEIRAWERINGDLATALAQKVARGIQHIQNTQEVLFFKGLTGSISHSLHPAGTLTISFGTVDNISWATTDSAIDKIIEGIEKIRERGFGGKLYLFAGREIWRRILGDDEVKTLITGQTMAGAFFEGSQNLNVMGVEVIFTGITVGDYLLVGTNDAYLVSEDAVINVYGLPNLINAQPVKYQPAIAYNEHDLQGAEVVVASRYLPVIFTQGVVKFSAM